MLLTARNIKTTLLMCVVMAITLFFMRGFYSEIELTPINLVPFLFSALLGVALVFLYLYIFPSQRNHKFITLLIPGTVLMVILLTTGLSDLWLIDELMVMLIFIFAGLEVQSLQ